MLIGWAMAALMYTY